MEEKVSRRDFVFKGFLKAIQGLFSNFYDENNIINKTYIRPPGAIEENKFLDTCIKCGKCAESCSQNSIRMSTIKDGLLVGYPIIVPSEKPCFVCDDLSCMKSCPSGALQLVEKENISIGIAKVIIDKCITYDNKSCDICIKSCPFPDKAIKLDDNNNPKVLDACIGCGLCEYWCDYSAIKVYSNR